MIPKLSEPGHAPLRQQSANNSKQVQFILMHIRS